MFGSGTRDVDKARAAAAVSVCGSMQLALVSFREGILIFERCLKIYDEFRAVFQAWYGRVGGFIRNFVRGFRDFCTMDDVDGPQRFEGLRQGVRDVLEMEEACEIDSSDLEWAVSMLYNASVAQWDACEIIELLLEDPGSKESRDWKARVSELEAEVRALSHVCPEKMLELAKAKVLRCLRSPPAEAGRWEALEAMEVESWPTAELSPVTTSLAGVGEAMERFRRGAARVANLWEVVQAVGGGEATAPWAAIVCVAKNLGQLLQSAELLERDPDIMAALRGELVARDAAVRQAHSMANRAWTDRYEAENVIETAAFTPRQPVAALLACQTSRHDYARVSRGVISSMATMSYSSTAGYRVLMVDLERVRSADNPLGAEMLEIGERPQVFRYRDRAVATKVIGIERGSLDELLAVPQGGVRVVGLQDDGGHGKPDGCPTLCASMDIDQDRRRVQVAGAELGSLLVPPGEVGETVCLMSQCVCGRLGEELFASVGRSERLLVLAFNLGVQNSPFGRDEVRERDGKDSLRRGPMPWVSVMGRIAASLPETPVLGIGDVSGPVHVTALGAGRLARICVGDIWAARERASVVDFRDILLRRLYPQLARSSFRLPEQRHYARSFLGLKEMEIWAYDGGGELREAKFFRLACEQLSLAAPALRVLPGLRSLPGLRDLPYLGFPPTGAGQREVGDGEAASVLEVLWGVGLGRGWAWQMAWLVSCAGCRLNGSFRQFRTRYGGGEALLGSGIWGRLVFFRCSCAWLAWGGEPCLPRAAVPGSRHMIVKR
jgi:hypothetical protein